MLKRQQRLQNHNDFIRVFKRGRRHSVNGVLISYSHNSLQHTRIGFVISKKFSPLAVHRNYQRRVLQAALRPIYKQLKPGFDIVISYANCEKVLPYKEARDTLLQLFTKTNLINNK